MFVNEELNNHLESSHTVESRTAVIAEWNMNIPGNIQKLGNYRYRPNSVTYAPMALGSPYRLLANAFDPTDTGYYYTGATDSDITVESGKLDDEVAPLLFTQKRDKEKLYYSLEDCIKPFRPRSGINKASFFNNRYLPDVNKNMYLRPRYYMPHRDDTFKYWRSYRTESTNKLMNDPKYRTLAMQEGSGLPAGCSTETSNIEYGISKNTSTGTFFPIEDAVPFVVYNELVPANRIVVKIQTHVGSIDLGTFKDSLTGKTYSDPFYGNANKVIPKSFKIQYLDDNNQWIDTYIFNETTTRDDGSDVFGTDGYLNLQYGMQVPSAYKDNFTFVGTITSLNALPEKNYVGNAYLLLITPNDIGTLHIWNGTSYDVSVPSYKWTIGQDEVYENTQFVTDLNDPSYFIATAGISSKTYREFVYMKGLRIVISTMSLPDKTFDLIEMSPRLLVDISDKVEDFSIQKTLADLGSSGLPVGQIFSSTGTLKLFDVDSSFNYNNPDSIVADHLRRGIKFTFYEVINNVNNANYYVPLKILYSENFPEIDQNAGGISFALKDLYFYFESTKSPQLLMEEVSLSQAVAILLDSVGFSNYVFKRLASHNDPIIPYFFIAPDKNVAEVLLDLAISTQSAMFFDEYNNFVVMTKEYILDGSGERTTDITLIGSEDSQKDGIIKNSPISNPASIIEISASDRSIFNNGNINYTTRYLQRTYGSIRQASLVGPDKIWIYKPVLLWEVSGDKTTRSSNSNAGSQSTYVLGAYPLNFDLTDSVPEVVNRKLINRDIDLGDSIYYLTRYKGYLYANGEIIRYDSQEFTVAGFGDVQISSELEYQKYFSQLPFGGKMYPTGIVNIHAEPYYETVNGLTLLKNGSVVSHGRGQFGTPVVKHSAGLDSYWTNNVNVQGCQMKSDVIYTTKIDEPVPSNTNGIAGIAKTIAEKSSRVGVIKNFFSASYSSETPTGSSQGANKGSLQSSALVFSGPTFDQNQIPRDFVSYVWKSLTDTISVNGTISGITGTTKGPWTAQITGMATTSGLKVGDYIAADSSTGKLYGGTYTDGNLNKYPSPATILSIDSNTQITYKVSGTGLSKPIAGTVLNIRNPLENQFKITGAPKHYGTRMRIIGKIETLGERSQTPYGSTTYLTVPGVDASSQITLGGGSGGIALVNPTTNNGYYFEIAAMTANNLDSLLQKDAEGNSTIGLNNILFYKVQKATDTSETRAIPVPLWSGLSNAIIVDDGNFTGQYRFANEDNPTVYDLAIEYQDLPDGTRNFYLYINQRLVKVYNDTSPISLVNNTFALFVRASSKVMFENVYALSSNYSESGAFDTGLPIASVFGDATNTVNVNDALNKYALSGVVQKTYLSNINSLTPPKFNMYYEEFGTIMRECAYFNIKYDKAYPALYANIAPTFNRIRGYTVSGFIATSYGAEFLVFNATDTLLSLDSSTGNYLRIWGSAFTQDTTQVLTVDDYYLKRSNLSDPELTKEGAIMSPYRYTEEYEKVRVSRLINGKKDFSLQAPYIQTQDAAEDMLGWIIQKSIKPRKNVGLNIFSNPTIQLGDFVKIQYKNADGIDVLGSENTNFVVYNIEHKKSVGGPEMTIHLSEV
jgi:hypothetical protein